MRKKWKYKNFPARVVLGGIEFSKARWAGNEGGVIAHYRENARVNSRHLKVYSDNTWEIDHVDKHNPDTGSRVGHFFDDYNPLIGPLVFAGTIIVGGIAWLRRKMAR